MKFKILSCNLWIFFLVPFSLSAATSLRAVRVEKGPELDGILSDKVWQQAQPFTDFKMIFPTPGSEPSERTVLRILYDESNLYIGAYCYDSEPSRIAANSMGHDYDDEGESDDVVRVLLDPFQDKRNAYIFFVNPRGARSEGLAFGEHFSLNWDGIWDAKSKILLDGWSVEIKIPFKTISFKPGLTAWGLNIERYIPRKQETIRLSGISQNSFFYNPMEAAMLEGIENVRQGMGITFRPYGIMSAYKNHELESGHEQKIEAGFDIYKNFTPNFVGAFSYNTDFAETEVDERRINLTRFSLYFPEKRTFFLEGSEIYNFGLLGSETFVPFFSRRIGLYEGRQVPVIFGTKFFGKLGNTSLAFLDVRTDVFEDLSRENFIAARIYQNILSESKVGVIFTDGSPAGEKNSLAGLDFVYATSKFQGNKNFLLSGWYVYNWNEIKGGKHQGYGFKIDYPNDLWDIVLVYNFFGDSLKPGIGFLPRNRVQSLNFGFNYQPRPERGLVGRLVRQFFFELRGNFYWDLKGNLETSRLFTAPLNVRTESGEHIEFNIIPNRDVLPYDFEVAEDIWIPKGPYNFTNYRFEFSSASHRPWVFDLSYRFGQFYSGHYDEAEIGFTFKYKGYATIQLESHLVRGDLPQGKFNENVYQLKADFFFSPDLGLMNYIQYDDVSKLLGINIRFRWQISPGNEIYLVYTKNWGRRLGPLSRFMPLEERGVLKIQLSIRP